MLSFVGKVPVQPRYQAIQQVSQRMQEFLRSHIVNLASFFGTCENTIRSSPAWQPDSAALGKPGARKLLQDHREIYMEARFLSNQAMANLELAQELVACFPDLLRCSEETACHSRHELGRHFRPIRSPGEMMNAPQKRRIEWCQKQIEKDDTGQNVAFAGERSSELGITDIGSSDEPTIMDQSCVRHTERT
jgi:hypothetical protein